MGRLYVIEVEPEVRAWLEGLPAKHFLKIDEYVGLLAEQAGLLGEPYARHLGDGVRELRPTLDGAAMRITSRQSMDRRTRSSSGSSRKERSSHESQQLEDSA